MVAPLLLGILGAGLASQAAVHGYAIPEYHRRRGKKAQGILDDLPEDAGIDDKRQALMEGGLLSVEKFGDIGFEDQSSQRDFLEQLGIQTQADKAAMDRLTTTQNFQRENANKAATDAAISSATDFAANNAIGIGNDSGVGGTSTALPPGTIGTASQFGIPSTAQPAPRQPAIPGPQPYTVGSTLYYAKKAVQAVESFGGDYQAIGPEVTSGTYAGESALGAYQVMPTNLKNWSKEVFGREVSAQEFLNSPELQDELFAKKFGPLMEKYGLADALSIWHSGRRLKDAAADGATDGYSTTADYVTRGVQAFKEVYGADQQQAALLTPEMRNIALQTNDAVSVGNDIIDYVSDTFVSGRKFDAATVEAYRTQAELTLIPMLQQLTNSGVLNQGELEQFQEWLGDPVGANWRNKDLEKFRATLQAVQQDAMRKLAANGVDPSVVLQGGVSQRFLTEDQLPDDLETPDLTDTYNGGGSVRPEQDTTLPPSMDGILGG